ncbi:uncharacterized protein KRP23_12269 [Phytophthora ramorum]|uniref:uncharacterized protein n=1 Tax=Phytophthora ramorum TaxID=164328 RepID=UPI0030A7DDE3|nr:hypothetical protein KRP23_12269 [Phytophthora ramorum]
MNRRQRGESLSERLRSEVQVSAALWQIGPSVDEKAATGDMKTGGSSRSRVFANIACTGDGFPCPREVKPLLFFYKYLQPIGLADGVGDNNGGVSGNNNSHRKLRVNLPLTVVCERTNAQEMVLWLRTDAQGNVVREEKTPLWRKKLHNDLVGVASPTAANPSSSHDNDPVLAVRSVARWKNSSISGGGSAVVLTRRTLDPVLAAPCELPICIQQFVHCRGSQASVYRIFWCEQERKCFAVNLTSSLKSTEAPEDVDGSANVPPAPTTTVSSSGLSASTMAAMNAAFDAAMVTAAQVSRFYCVTVSPDARACARWPKLRGAAIADGVQATSRVVEHVQLQLPTMRFHSMTVDFIKDTAGVWWLTRIVDFTASSCVEPPRDDVSFSTRDSAVLIPEALRTKSGRHEPQMDDASSPPRELILTHGEVANNAPNARICFLCGFTCELTAAFRNELQMMLKGQNGDEYKARSTIPIDPPAVDEYRMTLTMALDTIFLMRQRGVALPVWENAVSTVRKSLLRDVCDFPVCMLCYRIFQQQNRLQLIACELHSVLSPTTSSNDRPEVDDDLTNGSGAGVGMATSAASGLSASQLLSTELRCCQETPKSILAPLEAYRTETIPPTLLLRGDSPEMRPTWSVLTPMRGADVDPTATQLRLVFLFHELQDAGPDLVPTDFFLEYQLGQSVTRVQLEGSKRHTPNRWQLCEARVHYLCATLDAFSEFCSHKRLLIKMKAKRSSPTRNQRLNDGPTGSESYEKVETGGDDNLNKRDGGDQNGFRDKEEFFGYTLLSLRAVNTAAKWFGNSLQPESRTDFLLELHTASHGLLTLKLTVGLLVDPVPLGRLLTSPENTDTAVTLATQGHAIALAMDIGDFRAKSLALVLCELFEQMETLDNGYIEIAELRSLAKCLPEEEYLCGEEQLDPEVGMRERLSHDNIVALAALVEQQRRLAGQTLLHSLMKSAVMADAVARFDRIGYSEMSLEEFRELAAEALISQRKVFCAFLEEPKKSQDGFCLRHGFTELYATDSVCVLCASEYQVEKSSGKPTNSPEQSPEKEQLTTVASNETGTRVDVVRTARDAFSGERALSGRDIGVDTLVRLDQDLDPETTRRASSPPRLERLSRLSSGKMVLHEGHTDAGHDERPQRRRALAARTATTREMVDSELDSMLGRLHAAERTIVIGETQVNERKQSMSGTRTRQSSTSASEAMQHSDLADLAKTAARRATVVKEAGRSPDQSGHEKATKAKKRMKKRILKKTARRLKPTNPLPTSASLSKLLRMEFSDRKRTMTTSASETIIEKAVRVEEKRKQLDRLVLAEVQEVKRRLAKLLDED